MYKNFHIHSKGKGKKNEGHLRKYYCTNHPVVYLLSGGVLGKVELCIVPVFVKNTLKEMEAF